MSVKCPICGCKAEVACTSTNALYYYICENGCVFFAPRLDFNEKTDQISYYNYSYDRNKLKSYLFYHKSNLRPILLSQEEYLKVVRGFIDVYNLTPKMVENWYPKTFAEKINYALLYLSNQSEYIGDSVNIYLKSFSLIFFLKNETGSKKWGQELKFILKYLYNQNLVENQLTNEQLHTYVTNLGFKQQETLILSAKAWEIVYELQKAQERNKNVFVSMAFNENTKSTREAIRSGIINAGFSAEFIDEIIHNRQIVPEMLRLIRESRFLILDITEPNFGAYYEAGYAAGLGKEVVVCCKKDIFDKKDFICPHLESLKEDDKESLSKKDCQYYSKALRPHFDIAQKQTLVWEDESDLARKLTEWIKFLFKNN